MKYPRLGKRSEILGRESSNPLPVSPLGEQVKGGALWHMLSLYVFCVGRVQTERSTLLTEIGSPVSRCSGESHCLEPLTDDTMEATLMNIT